MSESIQKKLGRVRPPRVQITYDVETGGAIEMKELPFIVGILSNLSGNPKETLPLIKERKMVEIDRDNFDQVMEGIQPRCTLRVPNVLVAPPPSGAASEEAPAEKGDEEGKAKSKKAAAPAATAKKPPMMNVELIFKQMDDFVPVNIVQLVPALSEIYEKRSHLRDMLGKLDGNDALDGILNEILASADLQAELKGVYEKAADLASVEVKDEGVLKRMLYEGHMVLHESQIEYALTIIGQYVDNIINSLSADNVKDSVALLNERIAEIDVAISNQLNLIMHDPAFQTLEGTWRGMHYLVSKTETGELLKLKVLNVTKNELLKDMQKAVEFDQSAIFKLIYESEYGTYGGNPFSLLLGDYEFGRHPDDIEFLEKISGVAAAAHAPFIAAAYSRLFDMEEFFSLAKPRDLSKIFESKELIRWQEFRKSEDSRYITLTLPHVLLRLPYGPDTVPTEGINFLEDVSGKNAKKFLWGNPAFILGERITNAFALYGWTAAIRGVEGGGLVEGLPAYTFKTKDGDIELTCPTQVNITDRREKELNDLGFMAICHCKGSNKAAFFGGQTTNLPKKYNTDEANANSRISAMLPYILAASRFAHYIKAIMREKVGSFLTRGNVEDYLSTWIANYILLDDSASQSIKAKFPLRDASIKVLDVPGRPGSYRATVFLKPHFQMEELTTSIRLVAELPA